MSHSEKNFEASLVSAYTLFQQGDLAHAYVAVQKIKTIWGSHAKVFQLEALIMKAQGDNQASIDCFKSSLELNPLSAEVHNSLANVYKDCNDWKQSIEHYQAALVLEPNYLVAQRNLALCYVAQGSTDEAKTVLTEILVKHSSDVSALVALANIEREEKEFDLAELNYQKAIANNEGYFNAWYNRAINAQLNGNKSFAKTCFQKAFNLQPDSESVAIAMANFEVEEGNLDHAKKRLNEFLVKNPRAVAVHKELDRLLWETGESIQLGNTLKTAIKTLPENLELRNIYAEQLLMANKLDVAIPIIEETLRHFGEHPTALFQRAKCYAMTKEFDLAIDDFKKSLDLHHDNSVANDLIQLLLMINDLQQAESYIDLNLTHNNQCQLSWAMQGLLWREKNDERYDWLYQYENLVQSYQIDVPIGYQDREEFLGHLKKALLSLHHSSTAPLDQTLRNGSQTSPKLFSKTIDSIQLLKQLCSQVVSEYLGSLKVDSEHPFLSRVTDDFYFSGSWSVRLYNQGFHVNHIHPEGWISSSTYISVPPLNIAGDEGCIKFGEASFLQSANNKIEKIIRPENGLVVLFPSYTWHGTVPFNTDSNEIRLTAPFDVQARQAI